MQAETLFCLLALSHLARIEAQCAAVSGVWQRGQTGPVKLLVSEGLTAAWP